MDSPLSPPLKKNNLSKKLCRLIKQQQKAPIIKDIHPGKVQFNNTDRCRMKVVNFFGDVATQIFCLDTSHDDQFVVAGCQNGDVRVYNIYEGKILMLSNSSRLQGYPNTGVRWHPKINKQIAACNSDGTIKWYNPEKQIVIGYHEAEIGYLCTDYNCNGDWSVFGNEKYQIQIYDSETKKQNIKYSAGSVQFWQPNHTNRIFTVKRIQKEPNLFFSGGWDSTVRLWDVRIPNAYVRKFSGPSISSQSLDLKNNVLLVGNYSNKEVVQLWDFNSGKLIQTLDLKQPNIGGSLCLCAGYAHKSKYNLYAAGLTSLNKIKIFENNKLVGNIQFKTAPFALNFYQYNNKDFMVAGGVQGTIYVIKVKILQK